MEKTARKLAIKEDVVKNVKNYIYRRQIKNIHKEEKQI